MSNHTEIRWHGRGGQGASSRVTSILFPASNRVTSIYQIQNVENFSIRIFPFLFPLHVELIFDECYNSNWRKMN